MEEHLEGEAKGAALFFSHFYIRKRIPTSQCGKLERLPVA